MATTRASAARVMDQDAIKQAVLDAVKELPTKGYFDTIVKKLEESLNCTINAAIESAVKPLHKKLEMMEHKVEVYDAHFAGREERLQKAEQSIDNAEQYSHRACLRIYSIPLPQNGQETSNECLEKVMDVFAEMNISIPAERLDRVHRIGRRSNANGIIIQAIIVKFACWIDRVAVYKSRKKINGKVVCLDLTPKRAELLGLLKEKIKSSPGIASFAFVDINYRLGIKTSTGIFKFFNDYKELETFLCNKQ